MEHQTSFLLEKTHMLGPIIPMALLRRQLKHSCKLTVPYMGLTQLFFVISTRMVRGKVINQKPTRSPILLKAHSPKNQFRFIGKVNKLEILFILKILHEP